MRQSRGSGFFSRVNDIALQVAMELGIPVGNGMLKQPKERGEQAIIRGRLHRCAQMSAWSCPGLVDR